MKFWKFTPRDAHKKATKARRGHGLPYRPERRLITTEAARARVADGFRRADRKVKKVQAKRSHRRVLTLRQSRFVPSKADRKVLALRQKGLWLSQIAAAAGM